ncbi:hypothetical protein J2T17_003391 [Paenibacillus mucilaginosus]|uniref:hypothetical protein n=1 Tax=Paenibacillus mucilaginosus TaxID=61624 RepID=UPI003D2254B6
MKDKNRRILWLLNHKTLLRSEVRILHNLGFEVFVPKVIPSNDPDFRSGGVSYEADSSLTIPKEALLTLNSFNFYANEWPEEITALINHYFGTVFTIAVRYPLIEVLTKFKGQIIFRAFGLQNELTYNTVLQYVIPEFESLKPKMENRFWFGQGYTQLAECEPAFLQDRALYLPIGLDRSFWIHANTWHGSGKHILFVCPHINDNPYYSNIYRGFKEAFGDLPHFIVGQQLSPVNDPHVLSNVSDEQLVELYKSSAVFYYHSHEIRHVNYSPIEASIVGTPVIYYSDSLLGRLADKPSPAMVHTISEARSVILKLLQNDQNTTNTIKNNQKFMEYLFSSEYCEPYWKNNLLNGPFAKANTTPAPRNLTTDLPSEIGQLYKYDIKLIKGMIGELRYDNYGLSLGRLALANKDKAGFLISHYISSMTPGLYRFSLHIRTPNATPTPIGIFAMGVWIPDFTLYAYQNITMLQNNEDCFSLLVNISTETADATKEIRFYWSGLKTVEVTEVYVEKIT